jgi:hypothetical protein
MGLYWVSKLMLSYPLPIGTSKVFQGWISFHLGGFFCNAQHGKCSYCTQYNSVSEGAD